MPTPTYQDIADAFAGTGLVPRGGFSVAADAEPVVGSGGQRIAAIVLIGNVGGAMWPHFAAGRRAEDNPLDGWTKRVVGPVALQLGAEAAYPSDRPYRPFQRWARRAEPVHPSPVGILIHPDYGLWHAYRAALLFEAPVTVPEVAGRESPCASCPDKPCLGGCPVGAFSAAGFDDRVCASHLRSGAEPACLSLGCRARDACPVARQWRYGDAQIAFHMAAFFRARWG